ncbi:MAG: ABC transporter permease [Actinobacteria bacterium]|nr:ABC transporter permease [Actinomycetota bacterium]
MARGELRLVLRQVRFTNRAFWRNPASAFFTFAFPLMFLVIFTVLFGGGTVDLGPHGTISTSTVYVPLIAVFSVITACYTNIGMSVTFQRDSGVLKRIRGSPIPGRAYLAGRIAHAVSIAILLVAIVVAFGAAFYDAEVPTSTLPAFLATLAVGAATFCTLGLAVSALIPNAEAAPAVVNATILPLLFISQVFIPYDPAELPAWLDWLARLFPVRHFSDAMLASYFPFPGRSAFRPWDLLVMGMWAVGGLVLAVRYFRWEPRR